MLVCVATFELAMIGVCVYALYALRSMRFAVARLVVAISLGALLLALVFFLAPSITFWRSNLLYAMLIALLLLTGARVLLGRTLDGAAFKRRILVLGRSEEHTSELRSLMRISYAVFCLKKK